MTDERLFSKVIRMAADLRIQGARPTELRIGRAYADQLARELGQPCWRPGMLVDGIKVVAFDLEPSA